MIKPQVTRVYYDGKFTIDYDLSDGSSSAFRVDPAMALLLMNGLSNSRFLLTPCEFSSELRMVYLLEVPRERREDAQSIANVLIEKADSMSE